MTQRAKLLYVLSIFVVVTLLATAATQLFFTTKAQDIAYNTVLTNIGSAQQKGENLYLYTGSFFAKYNLKTQKTERLSDFIVIKSGISNISWGRDSVIFRTDPQYSDRDDITVAAQSLGVDSRSPHWWMYDFTTKQYKLLNKSSIDSCTTVTYVNDQDIICASLNEGTVQKYTLSLINIADGTEKKLIESKDTIKNVSFSGGNVYYIISNLSRKDSLYKVSAVSTKQSLVLKTEGNITYRTYTNDDVVAYETTGDPQTALNTPESSESHETPEHVEGKISVIRGTEIISSKKTNASTVSLNQTISGEPQVSTNEGEIFTVDNNKISTFQKAIKNPKSLESSYLVFADQTYTINRGVLYSSIKSVKTYRPVSSFDGIKDNNQDGNSYIDNTTGEVYDTYLYRNDITVNQQAEILFNHLQSRGFNPLDFKINWITNGADFEALIQPNAVAVFTSF